MRGWVCFIVGDAYQMPNTPMKGGCIEYRVHLSTPIMDGDSSLLNLCIGVAC